MPLRRRTLPHFAFTTSRRDSFTLPDYYRSTRLEQYGPYYRSSVPVQDLMKTIDLRGRGSHDSICVLPDIFEDDEFELDDVAGVKPKLEYADDNKPVHDGTEYIDGHPRKEERLVWLWLFLAMLRRCRGRRMDPEKKTYLQF